MNISADMQGIRSLGQNVQGKAAEYANEVTKIYNAVEELKNGWQGADNQSYVAKVNEYKEPIENIGKIIEDYGTFLIQTSETLQRLQDDISSAASRL